MPALTDLEGGLSSRTLRSHLIHGAMPLAVGRYRWLSLLRRDQFRSPAEVLAGQEERLSRLLEQAARSVPFYRRRLAEAGVIRSGGRADLTRFGCVPPLEREDLRVRFDELRSDDLGRRRWLVNSTSGSTGSPVRFIQDLAYRDAVHATKLLFDRWAGYEPGMRKAILWGSIPGAVPHRPTPRQRLFTWLRNELLVDIVGAHGDILAVLAAIARSRPALLYGYAEATYELAREIEEQGLAAPLVPRVLTSAGALVPAMRERIARVFGARVHDRYGTREVGDLACDCGEYRGLHVSAPTHYVEVVRPDGSPAGAGETGELLVTCLVNEAMPLIRYRIGDEGSWSPEVCPCGRGWPLLREVVGRVSDAFIRRDGRRVRAGTANVLFWNEDWISRYQAVQESHGLIRVVIQPSRGLERTGVDREQFERRLSAGLQALLGESCTTRVEYVERIEPLPSGKFRYIVSRLNTLPVPGR